MNLIEKAIEVAATAHANQYRKSTNVPYITHPVAVGFLLIENGFSEEVVAAGILHDTVEDTSVTLKDIEREFGIEIARIVQGASEENKEQSWEERKQATLRHLERENKEVCLVVCADKLHNLRSIRRDIEKNGERTWERFKRGKVKQQWYYRGVVERLERLLAEEELYRELKSEYQLVFGENKMLGNLSNSCLQ